MNKGIIFLNNHYPNLQFSKEVMHISTKSDDKNKKVEKYINRLEIVTTRALKKNKLSLIKQFYHDKYVITRENIIKMDENLKENDIVDIINKQKKSLDNIIDYFVSEKTSHYPTWFKYYVFQIIVKLGVYKGKGVYSKRTDKTIKPFISINSDVIQILYDELTKFLNNEKLEDERLSELLKNGSFSKIYPYILRKLDFLYQDSNNSKLGIWKKYEMGSDSKVLYDSIFGKGTDWCLSVGIDIVEEYLEKGDIYIYYTEDKNKQFNSPRLVIRTENNQICEIRGISLDQHIESGMEEILEEKIKEFPNKDEYIKSLNDIKLLNNIYEKCMKKVELTNNELEFLYEINNKISFLGYGRDEKLNKILSLRNKKEDLQKLS